MEMGLILIGLITLFGLNFLGVIANGLTGLGGILIGDFLRLV
jgi:hypothetical protein